MCWNNSFPFTLWWKYVELAIQVKNIRILQSVCFPGNLKDKVPLKEDDGVDPTFQSSMTSLLSSNFSVGFELEFSSNEVST